MMWNGGITGDAHLFVLHIDQLILRKLRFVCAAEERAQIFNASGPEVADAGDCLSLL